jgi:hypothetical protein
MIFFLVALVGMYVGRKIGWFLSKRWLYTSHVGLSAILCAAWGALVAWAVSSLVAWREPGLVLKIIMGYALGCYVSIPNFGLMKTETIASGTTARHLMISLLPLMIYGMWSVAMAWF